MMDNPSHHVREKALHGTRSVNGLATIEDTVDHAALQHGPLQHQNKLDNKHQTSKQI